MKLVVSTGATHQDHADRARRMAEAMVSEDTQRCDVVEFEHGAIGTMTRVGAESKLTMLRRSDSGNVLAVAGVPVKEGQLEAILSQAVELGIDEATLALRDLDGAFAAVLWNTEAGALRVVTDFAGIQPFYWLHQHGRLAFASEIRAFSLSGLCPAETDDAGWGAFIAFGHTIGDKTQLKGVRRARGQTFCYEPLADQLTQDFWWKPPADVRGVPLAEADVRGLVDTAAQNVRGYAEHTDRSTVLLSAGYDSRLILCLLKSNGIKADSVVVQHPGHFLGAEGRLALRAGRRIGVGQVRVVEPPKGYYGSAAYLRYLVRNEVATPSLSLFIATVAEVVKPSLGAVWDGLSLGMSLKPWVFPNFEQYLTTKALDAQDRRWKTARRVFTESGVECMREAYRTVVLAETKRYPDTPYGVALFMYANRSANRTGPNPLKVFANHAIPFVPGTDRRLWAQNAPILIHADYEYHSMYRRIYSECFPEANSVPFCSEAGALPGQRLTAEVWLTNRLHLAKYYWNRVRMLPGMARLLGRPPQNPLVQAVLDTVPLDHPAVDAEAAREIIGWRAREDRGVRAARRLLFYWQAWRLVMSGQLTCGNVEDFLAGADEP